MLLKALHKGERISKLPAALEKFLFATQVLIYMLPSPQTLDLHPPLTPNPNSTFFDTILHHLHNTCSPHTLHSAYTPPTSFCTTCTLSTPLTPYTLPASFYTILHHLHNIHTPHTLYPSYTILHNLHNTCSPHPTLYLHPTYIILHHLHTIHAPHILHPAYIILRHSAPPAQNPRP
jgi:hypothetical protein